jgi:ribosomal-protein-alanine N-acetyltransferase
MVAVARPQAQVRAMRRDDLEAVAELERASYEFPWSPGVFGDCLRAGHPCWVMCLGDEVVGYGILSTGAGEAHILNVCVGEKHRGLGLGRHLMRRLLDVARWHAAERVFLEVRPSNPVAQALYRSMGFVQIGQRPKYYPAKDGREDAIVMALEMSEPGSRD